MNRFILCTLTAVCSALFLTDAVAEEPIGTPRSRMRSPFAEADRTPTTAPVRQAPQTEVAPSDSAFDFAPVPVRSSKKPAVNPFREQPLPPSGPRHSRLINAEYQRNAGRPSRRAIQQVEGFDSDPFLPAGGNSTEAPPMSAASPFKQVDDVTPTEPPTSQPRPSTIAPAPRRQFKLPPSPTQTPAPRYPTGRSTPIPSKSTSPLPSKLDRTNPLAQESPVDTPITPPATTALPKTSGFAVSAEAYVSAQSTSEQSPNVSLKWISQGEISVGETCECSLVVKNLGETSVHDLSIQATVPNSVRLLPTTVPAPQRSSEFLVWKLGELKPAASNVIRLKLIPSSPGPLNIPAFARFTTGTTGQFRITEPKLSVAVKGPRTVALGDPASQIISISNPGTGVAKHVEIVALIPDGLEHAAGGRLAMAVGSLNPGETRTVRLALAAAQGGTHAVQITAEAKNKPGAPAYLRSSAKVNVNVSAPSVEVKVAGPGLRYKGRHATYGIELTNSGNAVSNNVRVRHVVPAGFEFAAADANGKYDLSNRTVTWFIGSLAQGKQARLSLKLHAMKLGTHRLSVDAITDQGVRTSGTATTKVDGIPALVMEITDQDDPVEVDAPTAYEIRVKNDGTKAAENIVVACEIPAKMQLVRAEGPAKASQQAGGLAFAPVQSLAPGKTLIYRVHVRGQADGLQRIRAQLTSQSITQPLTVEELTRFYGQK